ncbi:MAG: serine kinase [bacterium]
MKLSEIISKFGLNVLSPPARDVEVSGGYVSDLLSDVIANAGRDCVWVTMQTHVNIVAVASLKDLSAVIIVSGHKPADNTTEIAKEKGVCLLRTPLSAFNIVGELYSSGIRGMADAE